MPFPLPFPFPISLLIIPLHIFFLYVGSCVSKNDGTKLGNDEIDGTIEADGLKDVDGIVDGSSIGLLVGGGLPSGDNVIGGRLGACFGLAVGAAIVGTTLSFLIGATEGMIGSISIGDAEGAGDTIGAITGDVVVGDTVVAGATVIKSSARHEV